MVRASWEPGVLASDKGNSTVRASCYDGSDLPSPERSGPDANDSRRPTMGRAGVVPIPGALAATATTPTTPCACPSWGHGNDSRQGEPGQMRRAAKSRLRPLLKVRYGVLCLLFVIHIDRGDRAIFSPVCNDPPPGTASSVGEAPSRHGG